MEWNGVEEVAGSFQVIDKMERETGLEPATSSLGSWHSTTELLPQVFFLILTDSKSLPAKHR